VSFQHKSTVATLVALIGSYGVYFAIVGSQVAGSSAERVAYKPLLVAVTVLLAIVMALGHGALAIMSPTESGESDERDREIARRGSQVGGFVLAAGVFGVIVLALFEARHFYIANALLLTWVAAEVTSGAVSLTLYRRGVR
jgi:small-conductance mechanosensitive channel